MSHDPTQVRLCTRWPVSTGFEPQKPGDVGHDLEAVILKEEQSLLDRLLSFVLRKRVLIMWPLVGTRTIRSGRYLWMPPHVWCEIRARSSTSQRKLQVIGGTIDSGYRGELYTVLHNFGFLPRLAVEGERYAQVVFKVAIRPQVFHVAQSSFDRMVENEVDDGGRGPTGFGSTGA